MTPVSRGSPGRRRQRATRHRRTSSADLRFGFAILALAAIVVVLASVLVSRLRASDWTGATVFGGLILALVAVGIYSAVQQRRGRDARR